MLLRFRFANYRSFRATQELSMVASQALGDSPEGMIRTPAVSDGVVPVAALYGANASGKSNVLRAFEFMADAVRDSFRTWRPDGPIPYDPFALDRDKPSRFEVDFLVEGVRYQYGFEADAVAIREEWLSAFPLGRRQDWFHRDAGKKIKFSRMLAGDNRQVESMTRPNSLFLSAAAQANHQGLKAVWRWFWRPVIEDEEFEPRWFREWGPDDSGRIKAILPLLGAADLGIRGVSLAPRSDLDELVVVDGVFKSVPRQGRDIAGELELRFEHAGRGGSYSLPESDQSLGTLSYLNLLIAVHDSLSANRILIVDELDKSLHPSLARQLIQIFSSRETNPKGAQLIFNTHDTNLLDGLRRDQIWFTEKDRHGESTLYPLTDFKPRKGENIENGYLQGRYGAIPFINSRAFVDALEHPANGENRGKEKKARKR